MALSLKLAVTLLVVSLATVDGQQVTPAPCVVPPGHTNGEPVAYYEQEPRGGDVCVDDKSPPTQRLVRKCMTQFCCEEPCACNSTGLTSFYNSDDGCINKQLMCFVEYNDINSRRGVCCPGTYFVLATRTCLTLDKCANNSLGCEWKCQRLDSTSMSAVCTCPTGFVLKDADNRSCIDENECETRKPCQETCQNTVGSFRCSCGADRILASDGRSCIAVDLIAEKTSSTARPGATSTSADGVFPYQYKIAIGVASACGFLILLLILVVCCCCRRRRRHEKDALPPVAAAYDNALYGKGAGGVKPAVAVVVEADDEKKCKSEPDSITIVAGYESLKKPPKWTSTPPLYDTIAGESFTDDATADMGKKARAAALAAAGIQDRAEPNPYVDLPECRAEGDAKATGRVNADESLGVYAEIGDVVTTCDNI